MAELIDIILTKFNKNNPYEKQVYFVVKNEQERLFFKSESIRNFPQVIKQEEVEAIEKFGYTSLAYDIPSKLNTYCFIPQDEQKRKDVRYFVQMGNMYTIKQKIDFVIIDRQVVCLEYAYDKLGNPDCADEKNLTRLFVGEKTIPLEKIEQNYYIRKNLTKTDKNKVIKQAANCFCSRKFTFAVNNFTKVFLGKVHNEIKAKNEINTKNY